MPKLLRTTEGEVALRAEEEEALKATMDPEVREFMKGKDFLLFQRCSVTRVWKILTCWRT